MAPSAWQEYKLQLFEDRVLNKVLYLRTIKLTVKADMHVCLINYHTKRT